MGLKISSRPGSVTGECGSSLILSATGVCGFDSVPELQPVNSAPAAAAVTAGATLRKLRRVRSSFFMTVTIPSVCAAFNRWIAAGSRVFADEVAHGFPSVSRAGIGPVSVESANGDHVTNSYELAVFVQPFAARRWCEDGPSGARFDRAAYPPDVVIGVTDRENPTRKVLNGPLLVGFLWSGSENWLPPRHPHRLRWAAP